MNLLHQRIIGGNLKYLRIAFAYTQSKLSALLNISITSYHNYENGSQIPPIDVLYDLSLIYDLPLGVILETDKDIFIYKAVSRIRAPWKLKRIIEIYSLLPDISRGRLAEYAEILSYKEKRSSGNRRRA